jgi:hypothetical protein
MRFREIRAVVTEVHVTGMDYPEPTRANLQAEFPDWRFGSMLPGNLVWCRLWDGDSPRIEGEDWTDLRDQLRAYLRTQADDEESRAPASAPGGDQAAE